jgi:hypothetical protein
VSSTEAVVVGIGYLDRYKPQPRSRPQRPGWRTRASAQRDVPLSALVRAHRIVHARFLEAAMRYVPLLEPAHRVPAIIELVNRSAQSACRGIAQVSRVVRECLEDSSLGQAVSRRSVFGRGNV